MKLDSQALRSRIEPVLESALNNSDTPERLKGAMRYSTLSGGKRFRALLVYAAGSALGAPLEKLDAVAAAIECIHAYSLIHDDLPAMDDDDLRRGRATNHLKYDEATAILAGDALLTLAFELLGKSALSDQQHRAIATKLAVSAGQIGMVGGQMLDIQATEQRLRLGQLEDIHRRKTGALINAAVTCGALCGDQTSPEQLDRLSNYADNLGLAFQVIDDILDVEGTTEELGKPNGSDLQAGKVTYPSLLGLQASKIRAKTLYQEAIASIELISDNKGTPRTASSSQISLLKDLAELVVKRTS